MTGHPQYNPSDERRLDPTELLRIFRQRIVPRRLSAATAQCQPWALLMGGQPGIGKSSNKGKLARRGRGGRFDGVDVGTDILRVYHPSYEELKRSDSGRAAELTDLDARDWLRMAVDHVVEHRYNVIYDSTLSRPEAARAAAERFRSQGYRVEVAMVAGPEALSRLGILTRYQAQMEAEGQGHLTAPESHAQGYAGVLETADLIDRERLVDVCRVYRRSGNCLYRNELDSDGRWRRTPATRIAIERERSQPWSDWDSEQFLRRVDSLGDRMGAAWTPAIRQVEDSAGGLMFPPSRLRRLLQTPRDDRTHEQVKEIEGLTKQLGMIGSNSVAGVRDEGGSSWKRPVSGSRRWTK